MKPSTVDTLLEDIVRGHGLPSEFENMVRWDVLHIYMESQHADVYPHGFYAAQAFWDVCGHFPCGWTGGKFTKQGKRIID